MLKTTVEEIVQGFSGAKNLNAALKNFLKREAQADPSIERFAKDFRAAASAVRPAAAALAIQAFIKKNHPAKELYFAAVARYAYPELFEATIGSIHQEYAEEFNRTYQTTEQGINVVDRAKFQSIIKQVRARVEAALTGAGLPCNNFLTNSFFLGIFEANVLKEVSFAD